VPTGVAVEVFTINATVVVPLPAATVAGLNWQLAPAGRLDASHEKSTAFCKLPPRGAMLRLYCAACPGAVVCCAVLFTNENVAELSNTTAVLCVIRDPSVPCATMLKSYIAAVLLFTVTVKGAPAAFGVSVSGDGVQLGGEPAPQLKFTGLL
jgi:hypothetical protein